MTLEVLLLIVLILVFAGLIAALRRRAFVRRARMSARLRALEEQGSTYASDLPPLRRIERLPDERDPDWERG